MKTRAVQIATAKDLRRLDAAEQWAAELGEEAAPTGTQAPETKPGFKPTRKAVKTAQKLKTKAPNRVHKK